MTKEETEQAIDKAVTNARLAANDPSIIAHINLLQGIITRLASNSASCKTWCLTLVGALLGLAGTIHSTQFVFAGVIAAVLFGYLDIVYLAQEVAYRRLYQSVITTIQTGRYSISNLYAAGAAIQRGDVWKSIKSWSIWPFYGAILLVNWYCWWSGALDILSKAK